MNKEELEKLDYLIGFVNEIAEVVFSPDESLDPNGDVCVYSIGYSLDKNNEPVISDNEGDTSRYALIDNLRAIVEETKSRSRADFTKEWEKLRGE